MDYENVAPVRSNSCVFFVHCDIAKQLETSLSCRQAVQDYKMENCHVLGSFCSQKSQLYPGYTMRKMRILKMELELTEPELTTTDLAFLFRKIR